MNSTSGKLERAKAHLHTTQSATMRQGESRLKRSHSCSKGLFSTLAVLASLLPSAGAQLGTTICACSPAAFQFTLDFALSCPPVNVTVGEGIRETSCVITPLEPGNATGTDKIPVLVTRIDILELGLDQQVMDQTPLVGNYQDGDTFSYTSVAAGPITNLTDVPGGLQVTLNAVTKNGAMLLSLFIIKYTNRCDVAPIIEPGSSAGWVVFSGFTPPREDNCPAIPSSSPSPSITAAPVTTAPTTAVPKTSGPTTAVPATTAPATAAPTTVAPVTKSPTTAPPVTAAPTTAAPVTAAPTTAAPVTAAPTTAAPVTAAPTTAAPVTAAPTTAAPVTAAPTTAAPVTAAPVTAAPTTAAPVTAAPTTIAPVTVAPATATPVTPVPTEAPVTPAPTEETLKPTFMSMDYGMSMSFSYDYRREMLEDALVAEFSEFGRSGSTKVRNTRKMKRKEIR